MLDGLRDTAWQWGRFDVRIEGRSPLLAVVAGFMNCARASPASPPATRRCSSPARHSHAAGGFPDIPLMEDMALSKR